MKLKFAPACITQAQPIPKKDGEAFPEVQLSFYSVTQKVEGVVVQSISESGRILDTLVISISPKTGKLGTGRRSQPIVLEIDK